MTSAQDPTPESETAVFYQALLARDRRFDGRFFTAVHTTGIYCRPICPARTPLLKNVDFYKTAAAAEEAGFRPCQRCRPESAPGTPAWSGSSATVARALRLLRGGDFDDSEKGGIEALAGRLGIGERRLRQLFAEHIGASPQAVLRTQRLDFARRLIDETSLPMAQVAMSAGFGSIRRFNDAIKKRFGKPPVELRKRRRGDVAADAGALTLRLPYRPPYAWEPLLAFLAARAVPGVEAVVDGAYLRTLRFGGSDGWLSVRPAPGEASLQLQLHLGPDADLGDGLMDAVERVRMQFDLEADPLRIAGQLERDPRLAPLVLACPGLRVPGGFDGFELAVRAILGQQVSVKGASTLSGRVAERFGRPLGPGSHPHPPQLTHIFPSPAELAAADLTRIGIPGARAQALTSLAAATASGDLVLSESADVGQTVEALLKLPGVGPWTAQYIAMRVLRDPDAFPATDLVLRRLLPGGEPDAEPWRPWRAYAALYLWNSLA